MAKYETMMVTTANLDEEASNALINKFKNLIAANGTIDSVDDWGKKRLAYEIQKAKEAFYYFIKFESENSDCSNEVEAHIRIMEPVIRYLCVRQDA